MTRPASTGIVTWAPALGAVLLGGGFLLNAFVGTYRTDESAIVGSILLLVPAVEWAIHRRLGDFVARVTIVSESFDGSWSAIRQRLDALEKGNLAARVENLEQWKDRIEQVRTMKAPGLEP